MLLPTFLVAICATVLPASAHYSLSYPPPRGTNEDNQGSGPCGGFDEPSSNRTVMSTTALTVQLEMGHDEAAVQVLLGFGDNPGNNFNLTIVRTMRQEGLGEFCIPDIPLPTDLGIRNGTNATLQVVTNGDPTGGLYSCADITFTTEPVTPPSCTNGPGVTTTLFSPEAAMRNANESTPEGQPQSESTEEGGSSTESGSATGATSTPVPTGGAATAGVGLGMLGVAVVGAVVLI